MKPDTNIQEQYPSLFWDVKKLDQERHGRFIIERVLEYGNANAVKDVFRIYDEAEILDTIINSRRISKKTGLFWQNRLDINQPLACIQKQSIPMQKDPWNG